MNVGDWSHNLLKVNYTVPLIVNHANNIVGVERVCEIHLQVGKIEIIRVAFNCQLPVFHLAISNMAQRHHVAFCERHVALHVRNVALHVRHVALLIFRQ